MAGHADSIPSTATAATGCSSPLTGVVTAVPLLLFAVAAQRVPFTLLGALQYLVPTINLVLGWLVYDESMPADRLVGFALVWVALVAVTVDQVGTPTPARRAGRPLAPCPRRPVGSLPAHVARALPRRALLPPLAAVAALAGCGGAAVDRRLPLARPRTSSRSGLDGAGRREPGSRSPTPQCDEPTSTDDRDDLHVHGDRLRRHAVHVHGDDRRAQPRWTSSRAAAAGRPAARRRRARRRRPPPPTTAGS